MQLFICHASEDKPDFVRPLGAALVTAGFKVWLDEFELTLGDSLLGKISQGLASSDYGVVVLSPSFFLKKWPKAELDGLFALETTTRKMILPIWKDIDQAGVAAFSPILSGRLAVPASDGIDRVVNEITRATRADERRRELSQLESATIKLKRLDSSLKVRKAADALLYTTEGAQAIRSEFDKVASIVEAQLSSITTVSSVLRFTVARNVPNAFSIHTSVRMSLNVNITDMAMNSASHATMTCRFYKQGSADHFDTEEKRRPEILKERTFRPYFDESSAPVWTSPNSRDEFMTSEQLVIFLIGTLTDYIERAIR